MGIRATSNPIISTPESIDFKGFLKIASENLIKNLIKYYKIVTYWWNIYYMKGRNRTVSTEDSFWMPLRRSVGFIQTF